MIDRDHDAIEELLAVRALDGLEPEGARELEEALATHIDCATCREMERSFADTASWLALALEPEDVDDAMADRIIASGRMASAQVVDLDAVRSRSRWVRTIVAVAAAFVLLVTSVAVLRRDDQPVTSNWAQTVVTFDGDAGELAMAFVPGRSGVVVWGQGLADPGPGKTYELWMIDDDVPISSGCLTPVDGRVAVFIDADLGTTELMAVTIEPTSCPDTPSGDVVLSAPLV